MRGWIQSGAMLAAATLLSASVVLGAEETKKESGQETSAQKDSCEHHKAMMSRHDYRPELRRISELQGKKVISANGQEFGTVEDMIVDVDHARLAYAVISHGGFLGIGDKDVLLPFSTIHCKADSSKLQTTATVEQFKQSEGFNEDDLDQVRKLSDASFAERFHRQFDVQPYWERTKHSSRMKSEDMSGERDRSHARKQSDTGQDTGQAGERSQHEGSHTEKAGDRTGDKSRQKGPGEMVRVSTLLSGGGVDLKTKDGIDAGDLNNLMVDLNNDHIGYAIVDREHELAADNPLSAVPWELIQLRQSQPRPDLIVDLPVQTIKDAPGFPEGHWPDMTKMDWNERTNAYYDATPYYMIYGYVSDTEGEYGDRNFAQSELKSCTGTIQSINRGAEGPAGHGAMSLQIKLKEGQQLSQDQKAGSTATVVLGPSSFLSSKGLDLQEGQEVAVKGWKSSASGTDTCQVIARSVETGGKSVELRDGDGRPQWKTSSQRERNRE